MTPPEALLLRFGSAAGADIVVRARDVARLFGTKPHDNVGNIFGLRDPADRGVALCDLFRSFDTLLALEHLGACETWAYADHADPVPTDFLRQAQREGVESALRAAYMTSRGRPPLLALTDEILTITPPFPPRLTAIRRTASRAQIHGPAMFVIMIFCNWAVSDSMIVAP